MKLYGYKDKGLGFMHIFPAESDYAAMRYFADAVNNPQQTLISNHPEDFSLFALGEFDQESGTINPGVEFKTEGLTVKNKKKQ